MGWYETVWACILRIPYRGKMTNDWQQPTIIFPLFSYHLLKPVFLRLLIERIHDRFFQAYIQQ